MGPETKSSKVIIFDWDDTICPSSFVDQWKIDTFSDLPLHYQNLFNEIGRCAEKCLAAAAKHGEVIIITNSDEGWVDYSAERYCPNLLPILPKYRVVSARTRYERFYPGQPLCWKAAAFAHEVNEIYSDDVEEENMKENSQKVVVEEGMGEEDPDLVDTSCESMDSIITDASFEESPEATRSTTSSRLGPFCGMMKKKQRQTTPSPPPVRREVISFGDSMEERTAVKIVSGQLDSLSKSVMFLTSPSPLQLIGQLTMLTGHMKFVCQHESTLDLEISPQQAKKCAESVLKRNKNLASAAHRAACGSQYERRMLHRTGSGEAIEAAAAEAHHHRMD
mmetsp:Transcript_15943/g.34655  ORF Transcript_15943/g.34655 Transcript_15943/m.34655 type:complete len:335 (+) Transcript_15943:61-1065(+)|eukprot:CAMPEP_0178504266 /NCGR_PEP_ID=MMETSP0696-20121128/18497_1 /TAXON_ID=265572 /ORGANISM="Extubocellulus spinifer, Strain CCMP396" /LENGTH=334 /DNA_ID=CAMNT_0020133481 /DNA_START=37 /DNA_END=1041 /DNA_ORIENTATION=+